jgi:peptidyl-prolyl cis-trans isomerase B (cyclophilin B)
MDSGAAATVAANQPKPTTTSTAVAAIPNLVYNGQRDIKATDATTKAILDNLSGPTNETAFGKFTADKVTFAFSSDSYDKVDAAYRKLLEGEGWQSFRAETDAPTKQSLLVYQKDASKIVLSIVTIDDISQYPAEFKDGFKQGDTLILAASGKATSATAAPTPFAIPGNPILEIKPGQHKYATIEMEKGGKIVMELCPNLAPITVENFEKLATKGFYNGLTFHRVEKDPTPFVVQGGDPKGDGTGGPGYQIPDEFTTQKKHTRGTVAMAHSQAANSAGSQFYICLADAPFLDGKYAIFGQVTQGMDIVDKIAVGDKMKSVTIEVK